MNRNHSKLIEVSLVVASLLVLIATLFTSCQDKFINPTEDKLINPTLPTQPEGVLAESGDQEVTLANKEKIGYCVTIISDDWTSPQGYPIVVIEVPGKARWPNVYAVWFPEECVEECEVTIPYETPGGNTEFLTGTASLSTKKKANNIVAVAFRIRTSEALHDTEFMPVTDGDIADPAAGFTIHVHQDFELYERKFQGSGPRRTLVGYISIGDVHYEEPCPAWPQ